MNNTSKFIIFIIIALVLWFCFDKFLGEKMPILDVINPAKKEKTQTPKPEVSKLMDKETPSKQEEQKVQNNKIYTCLIFQIKNINN